MAGKKIGIHGTDAETGRDKAIAKEAGGKEKTCPVTKEQFLKGAKPMQCSVPDANVHAILSPREMGTGSLGYHTNGTCVLVVDGVPVEATWQVQVILKHSKPKE